MPATIISTANAEHYKWGGPTATDSDAWYLVRTPQINIIEERMPPGTSETPHHHVQARQFVFVLDGELTMMVEYHDFLLHKGEGLEVSPGQIHMAINRSSAPVSFLMTSQPPSHDDRVEDGPGTAPAPSAETAVTTLVLEIYRQMMSGKVDPTLLSPEMNQALTPDVLAQAQALFTGLGEPTRLAVKSHLTTPDGGTAWVYNGTFTAGEFQVLISLNKAGQVSGYRLAP